MSEELDQVVAATADWILRAFPASPGPLGSALAGAQVRQAVTLAAWLRYPTDTDVALSVLAGPGGSARLDALVGALSGPDEPWRTWVDEVVAGWALCLLGDPQLASRAAVLAGTTRHADPAGCAFRRLLAPGAESARSAALVRHPDLTARLSAPHRPALVSLLARVPAPTG